jgi:hypothetical protein
MLFEQTTFKNATEVVDGNVYKACEFTNCVLVYRGGPIPTLVQCHFSQCSWNFEDAADRTINFMKAIYHGIFGAKELIEKTFDNIRAS